MEAVQQLPTDRYHRGWVAYFVTIHLLGLIGLGYSVATAGYWSTWVIAAFAVVYYFLCHLAITIEAHRYYAHRSFEAPPWFHYVMVCLFAGRHARVRLSGGQESICFITPIRTSRAKIRIRRLMGFGTLTASGL
jgi:fatty-acid desaturase